MLYNVVIMPRFPQKILSGFIAWVYLQTAVVPGAGLSQGGSQSSERSFLAPTTLLQSAGSSELIEIELLAARLSETEKPVKAREILLDALSNVPSLKAYTLRASGDGRSYYLVGPVDIYVLAFGRTLDADPVVLLSDESPVILYQSAQRELLLHKIRKSEPLQQALFSRSDWVRGQELLDSTRLLRYVRERAGLRDDAETREESPIAVVDDPELNKFERLDRALKFSGFYEEVDKKWKSSGKSKNEFRLAILPDMAAALAAQDDFLVTDPALVLHLVQRLLERGFENVAVTLRAIPLETARRIGYFDTGDGGRTDEKALTAVVWTSDGERPFVFQSLASNEALDADFRINFAKPKVRFPSVYSGLLQNDMDSSRTAADFSIADQGILADGRFGLELHRSGVRTASIMAGKDIIGIEALAAWRMGVDPFSDPTIRKAVESGPRMPLSRLAGKTAVSPFAGWKHLRRWAAAAVSATGLAGLSRRLLGLLYSGLTAGEPVQESLPKRLWREPSKLIARLLGLPLRVALIVPALVLTVINPDLLKQGLNELKHLAFVFRNQDLLPVSWKSLRGPFLKKLVMRTVRYFTGIDRVDPYDYLTAMRRLETRDLLKLHDLIAANRASLQNGQASLSRSGHRIRVNESEAAFTSLSHLSVMGAYHVLAGIRAGRWNIADVLQDIRGRLSLSGVSLAGPALFDWMASTPDLKLLARTLAGVAHRRLPLDWTLAIDALDLNPNLDVAWITDHKKAGLLSESEAARLVRVSVGRAVASFKKHSRLTELDLDRDFEDMTELPSVLQKISDALTGQVFPSRISIRKHSQNRILIELAAESSEDRMLLAYAGRSLNEDLSQSFDREEFSGGLSFTEGAVKAIEGSHPFYAALAERLEEARPVSILLKRAVKELAASNIHIEISRNVPRGALRRQDTLYLDESLFSQADDPAPEALLLLLLAREGSRKAINIQANVLARVRELHAGMGLDSVEWTKIRSWTQARSVFSAEAVLDRVKNELPAYADLFEPGTLSKLADRFMQLDGIDDISRRRLVETVQTALRSSEMTPAWTEETIHVRRGSRVVPKKVRLERYSLQRARTQFRRDEEFGPLLRQAEGEQKETYVTQTAMVNRTRFVAVIGPRKEDDDRFFQEFLMELLADGRLWKQALKANVLVDISASSPRVFLKDPAARDTELEKRVTQMIIKARDREKTSELERANRFDDLKLASKIPFFSQKISSRDLFAVKDAPPVAVAGTHRAREILTSLAREYPDLVRRLAPVLIRIHPDRIAVEAALDEPDAIEELRLAVRGLMKYSLMSDLHLADLTNIDNFFTPQKLELLLSKLDQIIRERSTLIINGDLLELWQAQYERILEGYPQVFERFRQMRRIIYIVGNHDEAIVSERLLPQVIEAMGQVEIVPYYWDPDTGMYFEHGHIPDRYNNSTPLGRAITWAVGWMERIFIRRNVELFLNRMKDRILPLGAMIRRDITYNVERLIMLAEFLDQYTAGLNPRPRPDRIIGYGHTHIATKPGMGPVNDLLRKLGLHMLDPLSVVEYLNSGAWVWKERRLISREGWMRRLDLKLWELLHYSARAEEEVPLTDFIEIFVPERDIQFYEYGSLLQEHQARGEQLLWPEIAYRDSLLSRIISRLPSHPSHLQALPAHRRKLLHFDQAA